MVVEGLTRNIQQRNREENIQQGNSIQQGNGGENTQGISNHPQGIMAQRVMRIRKGNKLPEIQTI